MNRLLYKDIVELALREDIAHGDITSELMFNKEKARAVIVAKEKGVVAGIQVALEVFLQVDKNMDVSILKNDGDFISQGDELIALTGLVSSILAAERTALNFLQRMSGIASTTNIAVQILSNCKTKIVDTRKTTPGMRVLEKYAVKIGGGCNHRFSLSDLILIKENHIEAAGSISNAISRAREFSGFPLKIEVETTNLSEVEEALAAGADIIMLDNMGLEMMSTAVTYINKRVLVEASGNVTLERLKEIAETGVDFISMGLLTHSVKAFDLALYISDKF